MDKHIPPKVEPVKTTVKTDNCLTCGHAEVKHYGTEERNCNVMNCLCMAYKRQ